MKISNFKWLTQGDVPTRLASVDVTTGCLWWRKTETRKVYQNHYSSFWRWLDSGKFTPGTEVETLADAAEARRSLNLPQSD